MRQAIWYANGSSCVQMRWQFEDKVHILKTDHALTFICMTYNATEYGLNSIANKMHTFLKVKNHNPKPEQAWWSEKYSTGSEINVIFQNKHKNQQDFSLKMPRFEKYQPLDYHWINCRLHDKKSISVFYSPLIWKPIWWTVLTQIELMYGYLKLWIYSFNA